MHTESSRVTFNMSLAYKLNAMCILNLGQNCQQISFCCQAVNSMCIQNLGHSNLKISVFRHSVNSMCMLNLTGTGSIGQIYDS
jgi:hypothetical protein